MKIVYLANIRLPTEKAHGLQIMEMCQAFSRNGFEVELVVPRRLNRIKENPFVYYGIAPIFRIKKLPCLNLINLGFGRLCFWIESLTFLLAAKIYLRFQKYDILYTREPAAALLFSNIIVEIHSLPDNLFKFIYHRAKKILVLTDFLKERLVKEAGLSEGKILTAADGADIQKFNIKETKEECREKLNLPLNKKIVLYAGHLYKWKGAEVLLGAAFQFQSTNHRFQDVLFVLVGGMKNDLENFKKLVREKDLRNILLAGHRPHKEIPYYLRAADVLALPNSAAEKISSHYTSPMKLFEYLTAGRPIVASDLPSLREILNEQNAVLVKPDDAADLARGIESALQNRDLACKMSEKARTDSLKYTWDNRAKTIKNFLI